MEEQQLCRLRQNVASSSSSSSAAAAMAGALEGVARVYEHVGPLVRFACAEQVEEELEASVALLDACAAARDSLRAMRACALDLEVAVRRGEPPAPRARRAPTRASPGRRAPTSRAAAPPHEQQEARAANPRRRRRAVAAGGAAARRGRARPRRGGGGGGRRHRAEQVVDVRGARVQEQDARGVRGRRGDRGRLAAGVGSPVLQLVAVQRSPRRRRDGGAGAEAAENAGRHDPEAGGWAGATLQATRALQSLLAQHVQLTVRVCMNRSELKKCKSCMYSR